MTRVITARDLNQDFVLGRKLRRRLMQRARKEAHRAYAPELRAERAQIRGLRHGLHQEVGSIKGSVAMTKEQLAQALAGLRASGLKGQYLQDAKAELIARSADASQSVPFLAADARQQFGSDITSVRNDILETKASRGQAAAKAGTQLLKEARSAGASALAAKRKAKQSAADDAEGASRTLKNALLEARALMANPDNAAQVKELYTKVNDKDVWSLFAKEISKAEGVDGVAAQQAANLLRSRIKKHLGRLQHDPKSPFNIFFDQGGGGGSGADRR